MSLSSISITGKKSFLLKATIFCPSVFSLPIGYPLVKVHWALKLTISISLVLSFDMLLKSLMNFFKLGGEIVHYVSEYVLNCSFCMSE